MSWTSIIVVFLEITFPVIAAVNVWLALQGTRPARGSGSRTRLMYLHRLGGYLFLVLFSVMFLYMNSRVVGVQGELPPSILMHSMMAFLLVPLLLLKTVIARYHKHHFGAIMGLGLAIFAISFVLVALTAFPRLWSAAAAHHLSSGIFLAVIAVLVVFFGLLFLRSAAQPTSVRAGEGEGGNGAKQSSRVLASTGKKSLTLLLARVEDQTHDAKTLRFTLPQGETFASRPGQFLTFNWNVDGQVIPRCYSICSSPLQAGYVEITVKRAEKGRVSTFLHQRAGVGVAVEARGPSGQFFFDQSKHGKIVLLAGGSGITPMMAMLRYIDDLHLTTDVSLIYFVRTPADIIFENELKRLRTSIRNFRYAVVVSRPDVSWQGATGHFSRELLEGNASDLHSCTFFLCGPPAFMDTARTILHSLGVPDSRILRESFGGSLAPASLKETTPGSVEFVRSGKSCELTEGKTLLEIAESYGVPVPSSCRQGQCGTCVVRLLGGHIRMDTEDGLTPELKERGYVLACVGRADGAVSLDV